ncbi:MAG: M48 family metalloprotease [Candidatus Dependentiae bacterium]|nr:M48 family metalloprotease [Candidatus Dependentiae bacterium]
MKIITKLLFGLLLICAPSVQATHWGYWLAGLNLKLGLAQNVIGDLTLSMIATKRLEMQIPTLPTVSENVLCWCHEKLKEHDMDPSAITIRVYDKQDIMAAFFNNCLLFHSQVVQQLDQALHSNDVQSRVIVQTYSTLLDHEIGHLKSNDSARFVACLAGTTTACGTLLAYLYKATHLKSLFCTPTNMKELFKSYFVVGAIGMTTRSIIQHGNNAYSRHREALADDYAIMHAKDADSLICTAQYFERLDNQLIDILCNKESMVNPNLPETVQFFLIGVRAHLHNAYTEQNPAEEFRAWLLKQTKLLDWIRFIVDPLHPSYPSRVEKLNRAAENLKMQACAA